MAAQSAAEPGARFRGAHASLRRCDQTVLFRCAAWPAARPLPLMVKEKVVNWLAAVSSAGEAWITSVAPSNRVAPLTTVASPPPPHRCHAPPETVVRLPFGQVKGSTILAACTAGPLPKQSAAMPAPRTGSEAC